MKPENALQVRKISEQDINNVDYNVVLANNLIMANHDLTLNENKLILAAISQISLYDKNIMEFEFSVSQICQLCNFPKNHIGRTLSLARKNLLSKTFFIEHTVEKDGRIEPIISECSWVSRISFNSNRWIIKLSENLTPFIIAIKENFTTKKLNQIELYNNIYALRFDLIFTMEFNRQTSKMTQEKTLNHQIRKNISVDKLREMFFCSTKYVENRDFMKYIIVPAIKEINDIGFYNVVMEKTTDVKNKITDITFLVSLGERNEKKLKIQSMNAKIERILLSSDFSKTEIIKILKNYEEKEIVDVLKTIKEKRKNNEIINDKEEINKLLNKITKEKELDALYNSL